MDRGSKVVGSEKRLKERTAGKGNSPGRDGEKKGTHIEGKKEDKGKGR